MRWAPAIAGAVLFAVALWVLHRELAAIHYRDVRAALDVLPGSRLLLALLFAAAAYTALTGYDQLAFAYIGKRIARWKISLASFTGYAISNSVGFTLLSGTSARFRFYSRWGVDPRDFARIVLFYSSTFWVGLFALAGASLVWFPHPELGEGTAQTAGRAFGVALLALVAAYFVACAVRRRPLRFRGFEMPIPSLRLALGQLALSVADWAFAAAIVYALLPSQDLSYGVVLGAFLAAQVLGLVSHVPGGLGVFEGAMVVLLGGHFSHAELLSALVLYRAVYYLLPLSVALVVLIVDETRLRREHISRLGRAVGALSVQLAPRVLAAFVFLAGVLLLVSGATPAAPERLSWLARVLPLGVFEASHFLGSIVGVGLLIVARGVARRLDVAFALAVAGIAAGIAFSLLKGADWEEALLLSLLLLLLAPSRKQFDRRTAFFDIRLSAGWSAAVVGAVASAIWLTWFTYKHVEYADTLWWQVALHADVSRSLRAAVGAAVAVLAFAVMRLLRPAPPPVTAPTEQDLADAWRAIAGQDATLPYLVFLRDKGVLFNAQRDAFLMYAVQGRSWIALGDPVGPASAAASLIRAFVERAADFDGLPVFYQVAPARLHLYADLGMTFTRLGEEARVPLDGFSLEGGAWRGLRSRVSHLRREGVQFRVAPAAEVPAMLPQLREVSDDWLSRRATSEKGFSLGWFDPGYLARFPVAVMERAGRIEAFANLWPGATGVELSVDLMRYRTSAPRGIMDGLFVLLFQWGREHGYRWFNLGMAPLSGVEIFARAPVRLRLSHWLYRHGEPFYSFQGLRAFKEKFHPVWEARYLAHPVGPTLPLTLADIAALVAGGYTRIFR